MCARIGSSTGPPLLHEPRGPDGPGAVPVAPATPSRSRSSRLSSPARSWSADVHQRAVGQYLAACSAVLSLVDSCRPERFRVRRCARPCWVRGGSRFSSRPLPALVRRSRPIALRALRRRTCTPVTGRKRGACPGTSAPTTSSLRDELGSSRRIRPVRGRSGFAARLLRVLFSPSHKPEATARTVRRRHSPRPVRGLNAASSGSASAGRNALSRPGPRGGDARQRGKAAQDTVRACEWPVVSASARGMRRESAKVRKSDIAVPGGGQDLGLERRRGGCCRRRAQRTITDALARGESVSIAGFGAFTVKNRPARRGRNPRTGETIEIAAATVPSFKAGKTLRDAVA